MKKYVSHVLVMICLLSVASCSVKEMRFHCPCWLGLDFTSVLTPDACGDLSGRLVEVKLYDEGGKVCYERLFGADTLSTLYIEEVERQPYTASALIYDDYYAWQHSDALISLRSGAQADSLYGCSEYLYIDGTTERDTLYVKPYKQFANVNIRFINPPDGLKIHFSAVSSALETITLTPKESAVTYVETFSVAEKGDNTDIRICRQWSDSLKLELFSPWSGAALARIDLSSALEKIRYDFTAQSLNDIEIVIDFKRAQSIIRVEDWDRETVVALF